MNGRNYVPFKAKKSPSMVSTADSLSSELSCSTQVIGATGSNQSNGALKKPLSASTQLGERGPGRRMCKVEGYPEKTRGAHGRLAPPG